MRDSLKGFGFVLSPDGRTLATVGAGGEFKFYDASTRVKIGSLPGASGTKSAAFSHDGTKLATGHVDGSIVRLWDVNSLRLVHEFGGHMGEVCSVAFSRDDQMIISGSDDQTIRFWHADSGRELGAHRGHLSRVWNIALSPDGGTLASAGRDGTVRLWDAEPPQGFAPASRNQSHQDRILGRRG